MIKDFIDFININPALRAGLFFCFGAIIGSFTTALIYRIPRRMNWVTDRSRCTWCGTALTARDLVPIFSWLFLRGKCRHCHADISARYPVIELGFGLAFALIATLL